MSGNSTRGRIFTFYSFKGGVGRSMALANVAALLAKWGQRVLILDWDLEAPGIEQYFRRWLRGSPKETDGIVDLVKANALGSKMDWRSCLVHAEPPKIKRIDIISAGRDDGNYVSRLRELDWEQQFKTTGFGNYLEELRNEWTSEYEFVLVDSRTGITDIGGICTIHLPDALIAMFTANDQSLIGLKKVLQSVRRGHGHLSVDRCRLLVVPVPSRDESGSEYKLAEEWRSKFGSELNEFFDDWIPKNVLSTTVLNYLKIPYFAYWSFGERVPVLEQEDPDNPKTLAYAYQPLARLILGRLNWKEAREGARSTEEAQKQAAEAERLRLEALKLSQEAKEKEAVRRATETEARAAELKRRIDEYVHGRLHPYVDLWRHRARVGRRINQLASLGLLLLFLLGLFAWIYYGPILTDKPRFPIVLIGIVVATALGVLSLSPRRRTRTMIAQQVFEELSREESIFRARTYPYDVTDELAFSILVERVEQLMAEAERRDEDPDRDRATTRALIEPLPKGEPPDFPASIAPPQSIASPAPVEIHPNNQAPPTDYRYAVFISYAQGEVTTPWVQDTFLPLFSFWLNEFLTDSARVFADVRTIRPSGFSWSNEIAPALQSARCLVPILTPTYFRSRECMSEWRTFLQRISVFSKELIVPVQLHGGHLFPEEARTRQMVDFTEFAFLGDAWKQTERYIDFQQRVRQLAERVGNLAATAPPFSPDFPLISPEEVTLSPLKESVL